MNRILVSAGITILSLLSFASQAQLRIKEDKTAKYDSVLVHLPHETQMILVVDDIKKLKRLEETSVDSLIKQLNSQLLAAPNLISDTARARVKASLNEPQQLRSERFAGLPNATFFVWTGLGAGMVGKHFVPQFTPSLSMRRNGREYSVGMDFLFRFGNLSSGEEKRKYVSVQPYVNVGYGFKVGNKSEEKDYHRIVLGYLIPTNTNDKWRPSFKVSYLFPIPNTSIKLVPELYLNNAYSITEFNSIRPGLSIRF